MAGENGDQRNQNPVPPIEGQNPIQKKATAYLTLVIVVFVLALILSLLILGISGIYGSFPDDSTDSPSDFYWPWDWFLWIVISGGWLSKVLGGLTAIFTVGSRILAKSYKSVWPLFAVGICCLVGFLSSIAVAALITNDEFIFTEMRSKTDLNDAQFAAAVTGMMGLIAIWFIVFLIRQLGLEGIKEVRDAILGMLKG